MSLNSTLEMSSVMVLADSIRGFSTHLSRCVHEAASHMATAAVRKAILLCIMVSI